MSTPIDLTGRTAIVTGAAGGIGRAVTQALGEAGATVAAVDRDASRLREAATGERVQTFGADVTDSEAVGVLVETVENRLGPVDLLVNAAGVLRAGNARTLTDADWAETFAVNVTGVFHMSRAVVDRMVQRGRGAVVTVASNAASTPRTGMAAYAASKAAASMFTKCLGLEVARYGVRCNVVAPGSTDTPMLTSLWHDDTGRDGTLGGIPEEFRVGIPLGRIASPDDIADAVVFLLSDKARHITIHDLTVDGGAALGA